MVKKTKFKQGTGPLLSVPFFLSVCVPVPCLKIKKEM